MKSKRKNEGRVVTEIEEHKLFAGGKGFIKNMNSPQFGQITKKTVFIIALVTAVAVNVLLDYILH